MSKDDHGHTAFELERYLAGELDAGRAEVIERAADQDRELKAWIDDRRAERQAFLLDPRRKSFAALVAASGESRRGFSFARWWPALSLGAAVAVAAVLFVKPSDDPFRTKGGLAVSAAVLEGEEAQLYQGEQLHPGNRLRLSIDDPRGGWVTVILEETSGEMAVVYRPDELGRLAPGTHRLPGSLELDGELGRERLYVLVSDDQPKVEVWLEELKSAHRKTGFLHGWLPEGTTRVSTLEYEKVK